MDCKCNNKGEEENPENQNRHFQSYSQWSELPDDALLVIARRLRSLVCVAAFRSVCKSWRSISLQHYSHLVPPPPPWIMLPNLNDPSSVVYGFYGLDGKWFYRYKFPDDCVKGFIGSSGTWLIFRDFEGLIRIWNPLSLIQFRLPSKVIKTTISGFEEEEIPERFNKVVVSCIGPMINVNAFEDLVVVAIYDSTKLGFIRLGDRAWTPIGTEIEYSDHQPPSTATSFHDLMFYQKKLYAVNECGTVFVCEDIHSYIDNHHHHPPRAIKVIDHFYKIPKLTPECCFPGYALDGYYLVEVLGELMLVLRFSILLDARRNFRTIRHFKIFKLNFASRKWHSVSNLGNHSLLLGDNASVSFWSSSPHTNDCVYATEVREESESLRSYVAAHTKFGVMLSCFSGSYHYLNPPPIWIMPRPSEVRRNSVFQSLYHFIKRYV